VDWVERTDIMLLGIRSNVAASFRTAMQLPNLEQAIALASNASSAWSIGDPPTDRGTR
jgi:hypothetical protein